MSIYTYLSTGVHTTGSQYRKVARETTTISQITFCLLITSAAVTGTHRCLEGAVKVCEERMRDSELHHSSFDQVAIDVVVFQHDVLLQRFDGVDLLSALQLGQQHLLYQ